MEVPHQAGWHRDKPQWTERGQGGLLLLEGGPGCAQGPLSLNSSTGTEPVGADIVSQAWMCPSDMSGWPC